MNGLLQSNVESPKWKAGNTARTISLSPFDPGPSTFEANMLFDFASGLMTATRPTSLFNAQCHLIGDILQNEQVAQCHLLVDMFAKGSRP